MEKQQHQQQQQQQLQLQEQEQEQERHLSYGCQTNNSFEEQSLPIPTMVDDQTHLLSYGHQQGGGGGGGGEEMGAEDVSAFMNHHHHDVVFQTNDWVDSNAPANGGHQLHHDHEQVLQDIGGGAGFDHHLHHHHHHHHLGVELEAPTPPPYHPTPDLLNLFHLPRSLAPNSSFSFTNSLDVPLGYVPDLPMSADFFQLNLPPPATPLFRDLFHSLPLNAGYPLPSAPRGAGIGAGNHDPSDGSGEGGGGFYQDVMDGSQLFDNGVLEFAREIKGRDCSSGAVKHYTTERQRRVHFNDKFTALRKLIPSPTKGDRASIVADAIDYIKELCRTVTELKLLVEKKRWGKERNKRCKTEEDAFGSTVESSNVKADPDQNFNASLRSSWLQRKSKDTEVDVRITEDEVTIKLHQRKRLNCLLFVSKALDELQLDLQHVAGGCIGDHYSFLFNAKIYEGSPVYASAIANKVMECSSVC